MEWRKGTKIRDSVIHLMRGQVFLIERKKIFTFGGASSHDIDGGILEVNDPEYQQKKKLLDLGGVSYRINHVSWWKEELPTVAEMDEGIQNLNKNGNEIDFIVSHCCASSTQVLLGGSMYAPDILTNYFEEIRQNKALKSGFWEITIIIEM